MFNYTIKIKRLESGEHYLGTSDQMPGLMVHGESVKQVKERTPEVIKRLLEYQNKKINILSLEFQV